jgi:hypothetical protein
MGRGHRLNRLLVVCGTLFVACGGGGNPTQPGSATPTPTTTAPPCTAGQPMTSFTASPSRITEGDAFTLNWTALCGFVSVAQRGQTPFLVLQPSSGSYQLKSGLAGYPTAAGDTVYEAKNGDTATPVNTTVTLQPKATPTPTPNRAPSVSVAASASTCHPQTPSTPCTVTCTATASDPDGDALSYAWSGCASGGGSSAACRVSNLTPFTCSVSVSDGRGGTASGSATVTGVNRAPTVTFSSGPVPTGGGSGPVLCGTGAWIYFNYTDVDGDPLSDGQGELVSGPCTKGEVRGYPSAVWIAVQMPSTPQSCQVAAMAADGWGYTSWVNSPVFTCQ